MLTNSGVLLIHGVVAGDEGYNAAGAHNIEALREEVVVNSAREVGTSTIRRIEDRVVAKRNIPDHGIEEVRRKVRFFEGFRMNIRVRVEPCGDSSGHRIKLHPRAFRAGIEALGHQPEEMPHAPLMVQECALRPVNRTPPSPATSPEPLRETCSARWASRRAPRCTPLQ